MIPGVARDMCLKPITVILTRFLSLMVNGYLGI
jgi:hypothetical protein